MKHDGFASITFTLVSHENCLPPLPCTVNLNERDDDTGNDLTPDVGTDAPSSIAEVAPKDDHVMCTCSPDGTAAGSALIEQRTVSVCALTASGARSRTAMKRATREADAMRQNQLPRSRADEVCVVTPRRQTMSAGPGNVFCIANPDF